MGTVKIYDRANEFRIEIAGRFLGDSVTDVSTAWQNALLETYPRTFTVDISRLSGYDTAGRKLLHEMYNHGTQFAAGTPQSLVFLNEISVAPRNGPTLVRGASAKSETPPPDNAENEIKPFRGSRAAAAGK
jgi:hypothetical protein